MDKRVIFKTPDGVCHLLVPAQDARRLIVVQEAIYEDDNLVQPCVMRLETDAEMLAWIIAKDVPSDATYAVVDKYEVPTIALQAAWELAGGKVTINAVKAAAITK